MVIAASALNFKPKQATLPVKSFLQRLLLVTNGRISDVVRAYSAEEIEAVKLHQKFVFCDSTIDSLRLDWEREIIESSIVLRGKDTKTNYLHTNSYLVLERLDSRIRDEFVSGDRSFDWLLEENKVRAYREVVDCGIVAANNLAECFRIRADAEIIYRTYIIAIDNLPVMQITDKFPICHFID